MNGGVGSSRVGVDMRWDVLGGVFALLPCAAAGTTPGMMSLSVIGQTLNCHIDVLGHF